MDVSLEVEVNHLSSSSALRGSVDQTVAQAPTIVIEEDIINYLVDAMAAGDQTPGKRVQRRALIVAPQYEAHFRKYRPLPATIYDVYRVHQMLTRCGYNRADIRIMVDGCEEPPTRDNIHKSLKWLVSDTQPGDYRYFHFSGHGTHLPSSKEQGKEALKIPEPEQRGVKIHQVDQVDYELEPPLDSQYTQVRSLEVDQKDIDYYNEAIVTSYKPLPTFGAKDKDPMEYNMIRDSVLNDYFSELPKNSKLTCTLDCCHSARLINNNFKLAGAGFRGRMFSTISQGQAPREPPKTFTRVDDLQQLNIQNTTNIVSSAPLTAEPGTLISSENGFLSSGASTPQGLPSIRGARTNTLVHNMTSPPVISGVSKMKELLPAEEANRDNIKADMLTWSGCHQRQGAYDYSDERGGLFTRTFTATVMESKKSEQPITVETVYTQLNERIAEEAEKIKMKDPSLPVIQYAQVWTSRPKGDEGQTCEKLQQKFLI